MNRQRNKIIRLLGLMLLACLLISAVGCQQQGSDVPLSPGLSMIEGEPIYDSGVAMKTDHFTVTEGMMAFFFYDYGGDLMALMEEQKVYDPDLSLHDQMFTETLSWYDTMMNETLAKVSEMLIYCEAAQANGVSLTADQLTAIENEITTLAMNAASYYGMTADEYLQALYGPRMSADALRDVLKLELLATSYSATVNMQLEQGITDEAIRNYAQEKGLTDNTASRNIAYVLIPYVNGKANDSKVSEVLAALGAAPQLDTVKAYADSNTVGVEENMTPDNTGLKKIKDWLFADGRQVGDYTQIEENEYTYVMLYTGNGMSYAHVSARMSLYDIAYENWHNGWVDTLHFGYNYLVIDSYDIA